MKLLDFIPLEQLNKDILLANPNVINYIKSIIDKQGYKSLGITVINIYRNENAIGIILDNFYEMLNLKIDWDYLCQNKKELPVIKKIIEVEGINSNKIDWDVLSENSCIFE